MLYIMFGTNIALTAITIWLEYLLIRDKMYTIAAFLMLTVIPSFILAWSIPLKYVIN